MMALAHHPRANTSHVLQMGVSINCKQSQGGKGSRKMVALEDSLNRIPASQVREPGGP